MVAGPTDTSAPFILKDSLLENGKKRLKRQLANPGSTGKLLLSADTGKSCHQRTALEQKNGRESRD